MIDWDYERSRCAIGFGEGQMIPHPQWCTSSDPLVLKDLYERMLPGIRLAAEGCGYAIGVHGSMTRDLDLIAAPWTEKISTPDELAHAVQRAACGSSGAWKEPERKPHGRIGYSLHVGTHAYIDLSVLRPT